ncbi:MAG: phosphoribosylamine--glycine ligase [Bacteroidales bacterium]|nr:phosphoribosylamine--glycine ligase [Bacteroidales bacterium]
MKILLLGSGGREHTMAWKIAQSPLLNKLYIASGNAGTAAVGENINLSINDFPAVKQFVLDKEINMVVVGPEAPLVDGITDFFAQDAQLSVIPVIGPDKTGAQLEGSKAWSKKFMQKNNIPTARFLEVSHGNISEGFDFLEVLKPPFVLKADGLAAGKGVLILSSLSEAKDELQKMLDGKFGAASSKVVIEEYLQGIELSVFFVTDGTHYQLLPEAKDYKRIGEGDTGLNTGGMGAVSPVPFADAGFMAKVEKQVIQPTIAGLKAEKINYRGFVFLGLMNDNGNPFVIEYNVRLGDPETEVILPRLRTDLVEIFKAVAENKLDTITMSFLPQTAATVMLVSKGYPDKYEKGKSITGLESVNDSLVFHAGTKQDNHTVLTNGGRVIAVTSLGRTMDDALSKSYAAIEKINFDGKTFRKDIGQDLKKYVNA